MSRSGPEVEDTKTTKNCRRRRRRRRHPTPGEKLGQWEDLHLIHHIVTSSHLMNFSPLWSASGTSIGFRETQFMEPLPLLLLLPPAADMSGTSLLTRTNCHHRRVSVRPWPFCRSLLSLKFVVERAVGIEFTAAHGTVTSSCCSVRSTIPTETYDDQKRFVGRLQITHSFKAS